MDEAEGERLFAELDAEDAAELIDEILRVDDIIHPHAAAQAEAHKHEDEVEALALGENSVTFAADVREGRYPGSQFGPGSTSVVGASLKTHSSYVDVTERLHQNQKRGERKAKTADDALLSSLPSDALRWIKKRRKINSFEKVVLTHFRERQLRDIFRGLDFDGMGTIHLDLVKDAANYAEEKLRPKRGKPVFTNIQGMFAAMDEDGDGTVDFHEFTIAMTGSSTSQMDNATEQDVDKLTRRFIEFANIRRRERAVEGVNLPMSVVHALRKGTSSEASPAATSSTTAKPEARGPKKEKHEVLSSSSSLPHLPISEPDGARFHHFRTLFSIGVKVSDDEDESTIRAEVEKKAKNAAQSNASVERTAKDVLLQKFYDEMHRIKTEELARLKNVVTTAITTTATTAATTTNTGGTEQSLATAPETAATATEEEVTLTVEEVTAASEREQEMEETQKRVNDLRLQQDLEAKRDPEVREMLERIADERKYARSIKATPWLPPVAVSAVVGKPTLVPQRESPVKHELQTRLKVKKEVKHIKGNPEEVERERIALLRARSLSSIGINAQRSVASSQISGISGKNWRSKDVQKVLRYNFD
jgi:hypothetical protein